MARDVGRKTIRARIKAVIFLNIFFIFTVLLKAFECLSVQETGERYTDRITEREKERVRD